MGGGIGFVRDAQNLAKQNRASVKEKSNFQQTYKPSVNFKPLLFKRTDPKQLEALKEKLLKKRKIDDLKKIILMVI